jgi:glycosyltransferase involved in cell wall biosynthesis
MKNLAIVTTHPIQYYAPWFQLLAKEPALRVKVFYTWSEAKTGSTFDSNFARQIKWDIPLLEGYEYEFVENKSNRPGIDHFQGIANPNLIGSIASWKPDAVLVFGWNYKSHLGVMRHFKGKIPVLFRGDSTLIDEQPGIKKWLRRTFLYWVYKHIDFALYVGKNNKMYFQAMGVKDQQLSFVPHAIDNDRFVDSGGDFEEKATAWRRRLGIKDTDIVLLFAGKLESKKDPEFLIRIARNLPGDRYKFVIVGNGALEKDLKQEAHTDKRIIFLEFQNQQAMPIVYRLGDIFVLPSRGPGESWGLGVNEAMACARAAIISDKVGCGPDLVEEGKTGWVFESKARSELALANLLRGNVVDKDFIAQRGKEALKKVDQYSYPVATQKLLETLEKLD